MKLKSNNRRKYDGGPKILAGGLLVVIFWAITVINITSNNKVANKLILSTEIKGTRGIQPYEKASPIWSIGKAHEKIKLIRAIEKIENTIYR